MRLINADVENERLLDFIAQNDSEIQHAIEHKDKEVLEDIFSEYFEGQSTAYDVNKVVEQLEKSSRESVLVTLKAAFKVAVDIVKSGYIE